MSTPSTGFNFFLLKKKNYFYILLKKEMLILLANGSKSIHILKFYLILFYHLKNYFINYTILFYNTLNILTFILQYNTLK